MDLQAHDALPVFRGLLGCGRSALERFFWFAGQALGWVLHTWPEMFVILFVIGIGASMSAPISAVKGFRLWTWLASAWVWPVLILVAAVVWAGAEKNISGPHWRSQIVLSIIFVQTGSGIVATYACRGRRWLVGGVQALSLCYSSGCVLLASMSIAEDWL